MSSRRKAGQRDAVQRRLASGASLVRRIGPGEDDLSFHHSTFCQVALPYKNPGDLQLWKRRQGRVYLYVQRTTILDPKTGAEYSPGLPYGRQARLVLLHLNSQAVRNQSPLVCVEDSMTSLCTVLLERKPNGAELETFRDQLSRLASALISMSSSSENGAATVADAKIVKSMELWFPRDPKQRVLWHSEVRLSDDYFADLSLHAVPLDLRAVRTLANSAMALDGYSWLAQRLHRIREGKEQFIPWGGDSGLHAQFGGAYDRPRAFRTFFTRIIDRILTVYPAAQGSVIADQQGMRLRHAPPPVLKIAITKPEPLA